MNRELPPFIENLRDLLIALWRYFFAPEEEDK